MYLRHLDLCQTAKEMAVINNLVGMMVAYMEHCGLCLETVQANLFSAAELMVAHWLQCFGMAMDVNV